MATTTTEFEIEIRDVTPSERGLMAGAVYRLRRYYLAGIPDPLAHTRAKANALQSGALVTGNKMRSFDAITGP